MEVLKYNKQNLPPVLQKGVEVMKTDREKDVWLLGALTVLGGLYYKVSGLYRGEDLYPNLFFLILAPPSSGKGVLKHARALAQPIHNQMKKDSVLESKTSSSAIKAYDKKIENGESVIGDRPEEKHVKHLIVPGNSSGAAILKQVSHNNGIGIICESEADSLIKAMTKEWGEFDNMFNKAYHHEPWSSNRVSELMEVECPRVSIALTGVPEQGKDLLQSVDSGLFSRNNFYYFDDLTDFDDVSPKGSISLSTIFKELSAKVQKLHSALSDKDRSFELSENQWNLLNAWAKEKESQLDSELGGYTANYAKRLGVQLFRIAMILTITRYTEVGSIPDTFNCTDDDFQTSIDLADSLFTHMKAVYHLVGKKAIETSKHDQVLSALPDEFTSDDFIKKTYEVVHRKNRRAYQFLELLKKEGKIEEGLDHATYKKIN